MTPFFPQAPLAGAASLTPITTAAGIVALYGEPNWGPNGQAVYERTYSRIKSDGTKETWADTVLRVVDGNLGYVDEQFILPGEREYLIENLYKLNVVPAGRHLWSTGAGGVNATANCFVAPWMSDLSYHFCWVFDHLMTGSGVGANYSSELINKNSPSHPTSHVELKIMCSRAHKDYDEINPELHSDSVISGHKFFRVEDSREGWVEALRQLINISMAQGRPTSQIIIDVSSVRKRGMPIVGFGGTASGPGPLADLLRSVAAILNRSIDHGSITPIDAMEMDHEIARCVVAGNVRRSARMAVLNWNDPHIWEFLSCKEDHEKHWTTNISVGVDEEFMANMHDDTHRAGLIHELVVKGMINNGEPGYLNLSLANDNKPRNEWTVWATNPCGEQFLEQGAACSLSHVNLANWASESPEDQRLAFAAMARFAVRSLNRDFLDEVEKFATEAYRRIGIGFFGLQEYAASLGISYSNMPDSDCLASQLQDFYVSVRSTTDAYCDEMGWNRSKQVTTVAPTGSIATLAGKGTGCEPIIYRYFDRLVRFSNDDPGLPGHIAAGLHTEPCIYSSNTTVVYFPTRDTILDNVSEDLVEESTDISLEDHMRVQEFVQTHYVDNAISKTIQADSDIDEADLSKLLTSYMPRLKGVTVFTNNGNRAQAPFSRITKEQYYAATEANRGVGDIEVECANGACPIK